MINNNISVVTVTLDDQEGLYKTLNSLSQLTTHPREIIVIDGGSIDFIVDDIIERFSTKLPQLRITSETDKGIYDAMNKGRSVCSGSLIHYLNSGDVVFGEPYYQLKVESLLPVQFIDENGNKCGSDKVKLFGTAYNHQGIIFKHDHFPYDLNYKISADYVSILNTFSNGLKALPVVKNGGVEYSLGGVSTKKTIYGSIEMIRAIILHRPFYALFLVPEIILKLLIPRRLRRFILRNIRSNISIKNI